MAAREVSRWAGRGVAQAACDPALVSTRRRCRADPRAAERRQRQPRDLGTRAVRDLAPNLRRGPRAEPHRGPSGVDRLSGRHQPQNGGHVPRVHSMNARYGLLLRLLAYLRPHWVALAVGITLAAVVSGAQALIAWLIKPVMDEIFVKHDTRMLTLIPLAVLGAYIVKGVARYGQSYLMASVGERVVAGLRRELYSHLQGMSLGFFTSVHSGDLVARTITDVNRVARLASIILVNSFRDVWMIVALLVVMFVREWKLALIAAAIFPLVAITIRALSRQLYKINRRTQERTAELNVVLQESFTGIKITKAFGREELAQARFDGVNQRLLTLALKDSRLDQLSGPLMEVLGALGIMGALWYGGFRVVSGAFTPGEFFSFTAAVFLLYQPVRQISRSVNGVQQSMGSVERVFEILDMPPTVVDSPR